VVIKEYEKALVEKRQTREGHPVQEDAKNELRIHALLCRETCPHIIRLFDLRADQTHYYAVLEYASKGEFFAFVSHPEFTRDHARHFFRQLLVGVAFMHERSIAHRDLSLENILLDEAHVLKICDFGVACDSKTGQMVASESPAGKLKYMAPEVFARHPYDSKKADIWSCGVILFIMLNQVFPFDRPTLDDDRFVHACSDRINHMLTQWGKPTLDAWTIDLFRHIFCPVDRRFTAAEILQHPYCTGKDPPQSQQAQQQQSQPAALSQQQQQQQAAALQQQQQLAAMQQHEAAMQQALLQRQQQEQQIMMQQQ
jgi:serine/threonine protein kinase